MHSGGEQKAEKLAWKYTLDMNELRRRWFMIDKKRVYVDEMAKQVASLRHQHSLLREFGFCWQQQAGIFAAPHPRLAD